MKTRRERKKKRDSAKQLPSFPPQNSDWAITANAFGTLKNYNTTKFAKTMSLLGLPGPSPTQTTPPKKIKRSKTESTAERSRLSTSLVAPDAEDVRGEVSFRTSTLRGAGSAIALTVHANNPGYSRKPDVASPVTCLGFGILVGFLTATMGTYLAFVTFEGLLEDDDQLGAPSQSPTFDEVVLLPTAEPTEQPTIEVIIEEDPEETLSPTQLPTILVTELETLSPTQLPTILVTEPETLSPTIIPSAQPTPLPSLAPTPIEIEPVTIIMLEGE